MSDLPEEIDFDFEVLKIRADDGPGRNGAMVRYTPEFEECSILEVFVPVPFHKCRDKDHAKEILEKKIRARAPANQWRSELMVDESGDTETIGAELAAEIGVENESGVNAEGSGDQSGVSESSAAERPGSRSDGDAEEQAPDDHQRPGDAGDTAGPRIGRRRRR